MENAAPPARPRDDSARRVKAAASVAVDHITSAAELEAVQAEWDDLVRQCPARSPLLSHAWVSLWWRHFGRGRAMRVLRFRQGGGTIGFAPFLLERSRRRGIAVRQLRLPVNGCSLQSGLILPIRRDEVFHALVRYLEETTSEWDLVDLDGLAEESGDLARLEAALGGAAPDLAASGRTPSGLAAPGRSSLALVRRFRFETLFLDYPDGPEAYFRDRSKHFRRKTRVTRNRLGRLGRVELTRVGSADRLDGAFDRLLEIERKSWKVESGEAIVRRPEWEAFYRDVLRVFGERDACRIRFVEVDGRPVAGSLVVEGWDVVQGLRMFVDPGFAPASPGMALLEELVRDSWREGLRCIALDRRTPFLSRWATRAEWHDGLFLFNSRPWSRLLALTQRVGSRLRRSARRPAAGGAEGAASEADGEAGEADD
jgi:CelD/BcsL family acetyltransferase involved in cellulose biosynthesis